MHKRCKFCKNRARDQPLGAIILVKFEIFTVLGVRKPTPMSRWRWNLAGMSGPSLVNVSFLRGEKPSKKNTSPAGIYTLPRKNYSIMPTPSVGWDVRVRLFVCFCFSVCPDHNSKRNDPKVFKLGTDNDLGISYILEMTWFGVSRSQVSVRVWVKATAIQRGFRLYECLLVATVLKRVLKRRSTYRSVPGRWSTALRWAKRADRRTPMKPGNSWWHCAASSPLWRQRKPERSLYIATIHVSTITDQTACFKI